MKTYRIFGILIVTGNQEELDRVDKLASGTHHITAYGNKRGNPKHRHVAVTTVVEEPINESEVS